MGDVGPGTGMSSFLQPSSSRFEAGSTVVVHLVNPAEKVWGVLGELGVAGVTLRGLSVASFEDWMHQSARGDEPTLLASTTFYPLFRIERVYLDEGEGGVESFRQRFQRIVGKPVEIFLGLPLSTEGNVDSEESPS